MTSQPTSKSLVLITGASGFLGSYLVDSYVERGIPVRALLRPSSSQRYLKHHVQAGHVELAFGTMGRPDSLRAAVDGVTHIVHSAAVIGGPGTPWSVYQRVNIDGTAHLLRAAENVGVQRFTLISSVATYGNHTLNGGPVTEETPQEPSNPYGQSKLAQQELV
jgi:dihydroflavonol-4-reductase